MTRDKKKLSIDDESTDAWTRIKMGQAKRTSTYQLQWDEENEEYKDDAANEHPTWRKARGVLGATEDWDEPNDHPVFGEQNMVDNPPHYTQGNIECIDAMQAMLSEEEFIGFLRGNSFKYRWRMRDKRQPVQDLRKAQWYEKKLKDIFENKGTLDAV